MINTSGPLLRLNGSRTSLSRSTRSPVLYLWTRIDVAEG